MPTSSNPLEGMIAVSDTSDITPLGYLCWFSVPDESAPLRKLKAALATNGISPALAPKDTKAIHTFKRAMREQEGRHRENGHVVEIDVRQVVETNEDCIYQMSWVKRDLQDRVIDHGKAVKLTFNKLDETITPFFFPGQTMDDKREAMQRAQAVQDFYDSNGSKVTGARVRGIVRNYIRGTSDGGAGTTGLNGENLRGKAGGIYFVPAEFRNELTAVAQMLAELYPERAYLHYVPMADNAGEREIIRRHFVANTQAELEEAIKEASALIRNDRERSIRSDVISNRWAEFRRLERRITAYQNILDDEQQDVMAKHAILKRQLDKLIGS